MDFDSWEWYHWLIAGGGALAVLAIISYFFLRTSDLKVPAIVIASVACLGAGVGAGVLWMVANGYREEPPQTQANVPGGQRGGGMMGGQGGGMMGGQRGGGGMMGGQRGGGQRGGGQRGGGQRGPRRGGPGGGGAPDYRTELAALVLKLDEVTGKPVTLNLTEEQKKTIRKQIDGLLEKETMQPQEAEQRLKNLLKVLQPDKRALTAAGYLWPFQDEDLTERRPTDVNNPFKDEVIRQHLKALQKRVAEEKKKPKDKENL